MIQDWLVFRKKSSAVQTATIISITINQLKPPG